MKKIKAQLPTTVFLGLLITGSLFQSSGALAQQIAKMRVVWDFKPVGGAIYFTICDDPKFNVDESTGGCANVNVMNSNQTQNKARTVLVTDRLRAGTSYKACLVADNIGSGFEGRRIQCHDFVARDGQTIRFSLNQLRYMGDP
jgi:hypothetical protein